MMAMGEDPLLDSRDPDVPVGLKVNELLHYITHLIFTWA